MSLEMKWKKNEANNFEIETLKSYVSKYLKY